jgi:hypothetical protein
LEIRIFWFFFLQEVQGVAPGFFGFFAIFKSWIFGFSFVFSDSASAGWPKTLSCFVFVPEIPVPRSDRENGKFTKVGKSWCRIGSRVFGCSCLLEILFAENRVLDSFRGLLVAISI